MHYVRTLEQAEDILFGARGSSQNALSIDRGACYGCGLCARVCPVDCITMVEREKWP